MTTVSHLIGSTRHYRENYDDQLSYIMWSRNMSTPVISHTSINSPNIHTGEKKVTLKRELGFITSTAMLFNIFLGSGIFFAPSNILQHSGSFGFSLCLWAFGGVFALSGALCYLELALMVKKSGSTYTFIKEAFSFGRRKPWMERVGSLCGFQVAWIQVVILQPLAHSIILVTLGRYLCRPFFITCDHMPLYAVKCLALFVSTFLMVINVYSIKMAAKFLNFICSFKLLLLIFVIAVGVYKLIRNRSFPEDSRHPFEGSNFSPAGIALSFYGIMFAYDGWDVGVMVQEETKNASKNLLRALVIAIPMAGGFFILVNVAFFSVLSYDEILHNKAVGLTFGHAVFGEPGMIVICVVIVILLLGTAHGNLLAVSRIVFVCSREGSMPRFVSGIHRTFRTPVYAIVIQAVATNVLIVIGSLDNLLNAMSAVNWSLYCAAFIGLIVMRITEPDRPRPFQVLLLFPGVMVLVSLFLVVLPLWKDPIPQLLAFAVSGLGVPLYCVFIMEEPCRLRPKFVDRFSTWLVLTTSRVFNTELSTKI